MLESARVPCIDLPASHEPLLSIFEYEAVFNDLLLELIRRFAINQRSWPSKGHDDPLYGFFRLG
jgi:hypothetical protein